MMLFLVSEASYTQNTQVLVGELGLKQFRIWKLSFMVFPPLSPPQFQPDFTRWNESLVRQSTQPVFACNN